MLTSMLPAMVHAELDKTPWIGKDPLTKHHFRRRKRKQRHTKKGINKQPGAAAMLTASITPGATQQGFPPEMQRFRGS